jgi:hypothetical protein
MSITVDKVIKGYIALRDKKAEMQSRHKEELAPLNDKMEKLEGWLQRDLLARKVESERTEEGTAYMQTVVSTSVRDRDAFLQFVIDNEMWELIENRAAKSVVVDYLENTGEIVPGVNYEAAKVVRVRRK